MPEDFKIALVQTNLFWEAPEKNRELFTEKIKSITKEVDLIVLPEMFTSGFTMNPEKVAEPMGGKTIKWLCDIAREVHTAITGSLVIEEKGNYFNRLVFVSPTGTIKQYDKRHTFTLAGEDKVYAAGHKKLIVNYKGWKICLLICYDLRFPVWARNTEDYHLLVYVANWPEVRIDAWNTLLKARAIENMTYCVGVNRTGMDGLKFSYPGQSAVYNYLGKKLTTFASEESIQIISLNREDLIKTRQKLQFLSDRDHFTIEP